MRSTHALRRMAPLPAFVLAFAACAHGANTRTTPPVGMYALQVNGKAVDVPIVNSVYDALRRTTSASVLGDLSGFFVRPLVVFDGTENLDGLRALMAMPVCEAEAVELLRPVRAVALYGAKAGAGAIVIRTRRGGTQRAGC